ncbi:MAG TPA: tRNA epoxyqueuosine(34) reductase QueG [Gaiella sp.]|jgi:epoxyqueuosine reductase|nr:tRNA epoxyqueuosine(34) reductase QueG [Gaiella sp.]
MTVDELRSLADELGLDVVGAAAAAPYEETERHIRERRARGLFGSMRFTMARPEVSCHPETLLERARTVVSAALCYYAPAPEPGTGEGRLPRYAWRDNYALLRERLDELGRRLGGDYRVLVDANQHVDRAGAERSGVGFIGKNTMLITRTHGSWVVLGTLVTEVELEATAPVAAGCGTCTLCIDACPTGALDEPGVLDATRCLSYWTQTADDIPDDVMDALGDRVYGCDICQDVCPWNVGIEKRRADAALDEADQPTASLADWLTRDDRELVAELDRLFVPGNDARWLRRNALVAVGNVGSADDAPLVDAFLDDDRPVLRRVARRASERIGERA